LQSHRASSSNASTPPRSVSATRVPAWVKIFGAIYLVAVATFAAMHFAGEGMGYHIHGEMNAHGRPAEHGQHQP